MSIFKKVLICAIISVNCHYELMAISIIEHYRNSCYAVTGNEQHFENLQNHYNRLYKKYASQDLKACSGYFCSEPLTELMYETKEIRKYVMACHHEQNRFLGHWLITSFEGLLKFWCYNDANYTTRYYSAETQECQRTLTNNNNSQAQAFKSCFLPFTGSVGQNRTSEETCKILSITTICFEDLIKKNCKAEPLELFKKFSKIIYTPCNGAYKFEISLVLIITVIHFFVN